MLAVAYSALWLRADPSEWNFPSLLLGAVLFPAVAYLISQLFVGRLLLARLLSPYRPQGEPHQQLERLKDLSVQRVAEEAAHRLERLSIGLLLIAISLLAPLTIHMFVSFLFVRGFAWTDSFSVWIVASLVIVGHCHLLLAWLSWGYSKRVSGASIEEFALMQGAGWRALGVTTLSSFIPAIFAGPLFFVLMIVSSA